MESEATLNAGDVCLDCQQKGFEKYLRYFKINLNGDTILKCESNQCMYPYNDEFCSSDDDEDVKSLDNISQTNSLKLINDLIQQFDYDEQNEQQQQVYDVGLNNHDPLTESVSEQVTQFDITFLDDFNTADNENVCKTEMIDEKFEAKSIKYDIHCQKSGDNKYAQNNYEESFTNFCAAYEMPTNKNMTDMKEKITIQSVETLKKESPLYHELPTTSKNLLSSNENSTSGFLCLTPLAAEDQEKKCISECENIELKTKKLPVARKITPKKSQTFDIPKADILKANAVLKNLATIEEKEKCPKFSRKYKSIRRQPKPNIEKSNLPEPPSLNTDSNYSFDKITQMLMAKK